MSIIARVRERGIALGRVRRWLPASIEYLWLRSRTPKGNMLVAIYGNASLGESASPINTLQELRMFRRSPVTETLDYYAVNNTSFHS